MNEGALGPVPARTRPTDAGERARDERDGGAAMFDSIARRYDLLNRVLSAGLDGGWRRRAIRELGPRPGQVLLDLCTGTGDFAFAALGVPGTRVIGLDVAREMVRIGRSKAGRLGLSSRLRFGLGDAENLPLADGSIDGALIAFGIRNVPDRSRALAELARVMKPGGRLVILEFGIPPNRLFRAVYFFYFRHILPVLGGILSGNRKAYDYLPDSVMKFPAADRFEALGRDSGFGKSRATRLAGGIVTLYVFTR